MDGHKLPYYRMSPAQTLADLRSQTSGLSNAEAADRLHHVGQNRLERARHTPLWRQIARQFKGLLVLTMFASAGLAFYLHATKTGVVLALIGIINAVIGYFQERMSGSIQNSLDNLTSHHARVLRSSKLHDVDSSLLVPGDILYLEAGDSVPADARILQEDELATDDFPLTGATRPTRKFKHALSGDVPAAGRHNMVYMGTEVLTGNCYAAVTATGMHTELGHLASLSRQVRPDTSPLRREINNLALRLTQGILLLVAILTVVQLQSSIEIKTALLFAISLATAITPNGLAAELNIVLAQTAGRLARSRAQIKKLSAAETLGAASIIIADKTGTLTHNVWTATHAIIGRTEYTISGTGYALNGAVCTATGRPLGGQALKDLHLFFQTGALASNAEVNPPDDNHTDWHVVGDPTEGALITLARKAGLEPNALDNLFPEHKEYAFDAARGRMTSVREVEGQLYAFVKGAPEAVMAASSSLWDHGHTRRLTAADRQFYADYAERHAAAAERTLALAYRVLPRGFDPLKAHLDDAEQKLIFLGLISMVDPLRTDVPAAMTAAHTAGIKVSIMTADYPTAALAVARQAGLAGVDNKRDITVVTGTELPSLSDHHVLRLLEQGGAVFSRMSAEDKLRLTGLAEAADHVVAITGDGINDVPALKRADVGVAMGHTGSDAAKQAAEIVLMDDGFPSLLAAIGQSRISFQNISRAVRCALTDNMSQVMVVLISLLATVIWDIPAAITAIQILAIDLAAQLLPITALGWDPAAKRLMRTAPRRTHEHLLTRRTAAEFAVYGLLTAVLAYANYLFFFARHHISPLHLGTNSHLYFAASILTFVTIVFCQSINLLLVRSEGALFTRLLWSNKKLLAAFATSLFVTINIVYNPVLQSWFGSAALTGWDWLTVVGAASVYTAIRLFHRHTRRHSAGRLIKKHGPVKVRAHLQKRPA